MGSRKNHVLNTIEAKNHLKLNLTGNSRNWDYAYFLTKIGQPCGCPFFMSDINECKKYFVVIEFPTWHP